MDVSIIIVSFNTKELLIDCLNSLKKALKRKKRLSVVMPALSKKSQN